MDTVIEILSPDELLERVDTEPKNADLFEEVELEGGQVKRRLHYLRASEYRHQTHVTLYLDGRIVGISGLMVNPYNEVELWVQHVSVEEGFRGMGLASRLVEAVYAYALEHKKKVTPSSFTQLGQRLKHVFERLDAQHPEAACGLPHQNF